MVAVCVAAIGLLATVSFASIEIAASTENDIGVSGVVHDADGRPLIGASVLLGGVEVVTDDGGRWMLEVSPGVHLLEVSLEGYISVRRELSVAAELGLVDVMLVPPLHLSENVVVRAVRAEKRTPVTKTDIGREQVEAVNRGQEMPFLLGPTPSANYNADSGVAAGYSYFNLRGIGQTRPRSRTKDSRCARRSAVSLERSRTQQPGGTPAVSLWAIACLCR